MKWPQISIGMIFSVSLDFKLCLKNHLNLSNIGLKLKLIKTYFSENILATFRETCVGKVQSLLANPGLRPKRHLLKV